MNSSGESAAREREAEALARMFHETYERLAPEFGYKTREESAVPWEQVPDNNKRLMIAVCGEIASHYAAREREEWIPVSERLPERSGDVLIAGHAWTVEGGLKVLSVEAAFFNGHTRLFWVPENDGDTKRAAAAATHWRPLPAAPFAAKGETGSVAAQGEQHD